LLKIKNFEKQFFSVSGPELTGARTPGTSGRTSSSLRRSTRNLVLKHLRKIRLFIEKHFDKIVCYHKNKKV
jgi:hypothetical protein